MKRTVLILIALALFAHGVDSDAAERPLVSRVHWITIHARTPEAFDTLHRLFNRDMQLPVFFGPETHGQRRYLAVTAGRVILELCGPFPDSPYRDARALARFNSVFLRPHGTLAATVTELASRELPHEPPKVVPWDENEQHVRLTALSAAGMPLTISERIKEVDALESQLEVLRLDLAGRKGGPLGIRELDEIQIGYSDEGRLSRWQALLRPIQPAAGHWKLAEKPGLRLVPDDRDEVVALVFKVESLDHAKRQLEALDLLGPAQGTILHIAPGRTCGLKLMLQEGPP